MRIQWILLSFPGKAQNVIIKPEINYSDKGKEHVRTIFPHLLLPSYFLGTMQLCLACGPHMTPPFLGILQQQISWRSLRKAHRAVLQLYPIHHRHERNLCVDFAHRFDYF